MPDPIHRVRVIPEIDVKVSGGRGAPGKSAYASYLQTTTDDPVLTEQEWSDSAGSAAITVSNGVGSFVSSGTTYYFPVSTVNPFP